MESYTPISHNLLTQSPVLMCVYELFEMKRWGKEADFFFLNSIPLKMINLGCDWAPQAA